MIAQSLILLTVILHLLGNHGDGDGDCVLPGLLSPGLHREDRPGSELAYGILSFSYFSSTEGLC